MAHWPVLDDELRLVRHVSELDGSGPEVTLLDG